MPQKKNIHDDISRMRTRSINKYFLRPLNSILTKKTLGFNFSRERYRWKRKKSRAEIKHESTLAFAFQTKTGIDGKSLYFFLFQKFAYLACRIINIQHSTAYLAVRSKKEKKYAEENVSV